MNEDRPWLPQFAHAVLVGVTAVAAFLTTKNQLVAAAVTVFASRFLGEFVNRVVPPKRKNGFRVRHTGPTTPEEIEAMRKRLEVMRERVAVDVHREVNRLATWRAEFDLSVDDALRRLPEPQGES